MLHRHGCNRCPPVHCAALLPTASGHLSLAASHPLPQCLLASKKLQCPATAPSHAHPDISLAGGLGLMVAPTP